MSEHYEAQLKRQLAEARERAAKAEARIAAQAAELAQWRAAAEVPLLPTLEGERDHARQQLAAAEARLAAIRIVLDRYLGCASDEAAVLRAEVKAALDGPAVRPRCCVCGTTEHGGRTYENHRGQLFCIPCADGNRPSCPLGDGCHGVNCPQAANHGPRTAGSPS